MAAVPVPRPLTEGEVRARVIDMVTSQHAAAVGPVLVIEELGLGRGSARADLVVLDAGSMTGIEIKSAADSLTRLPRQATWYGRVCDRSVLAGDPAHVEAAAATLPAWWGLTAVDHDACLVSRAPMPNPDPDPLALASMLWMPELKAAVVEAGQGGGTAGMERADVATVLARAAGPDLGTLVRAQLLQRAWVDVADPVGPVRVVRQPAPSKRVARRARVRSKHERRQLRARG